MLTSEKCFKKYGDPTLLTTQQKWFETWEVPKAIQQAFNHVRFSAVGTIGFPKRIFVNKDFKLALEKGLRNVITRGYAKEMITWDGCFIIRQKRNRKSMSLHSWALAFDTNQEKNALGATPTLSKGFVECFKDAGFDWGGDWKIPDGMHFQLIAI